MKKNEDFIDFYHSLYKDIMDEYYSTFNDTIRKNIKNASVTALILIIIPVVILIFAFRNIMMGDTLFWIVFIYIIIVLIYIAIGIKQVADKELRVMKSKIIDDLLTFISDDGECEYLPRSRVSKESFEKTNLFDLNLVNYNGSNYIKAKYDKTTIILADIEIYVYTDRTRKVYYASGGKNYVKTYNEKVKDMMFEGSYFGADLNKKNDTIIYLIPITRHSIFTPKRINSYITYDGKPVELENLEFSNKYKVYSTDEIKARYILTLSVMEKINQLDTIFPGKKFLVFRNDGRFSVFIEGHTIESIKDMPLSPIRNFDKELTDLTNIFNKINNYFSIYNILDLSKDIYKKKS